MPAVAVNFTHRIIYTWIITADFTSLDTLDLIYFTDTTQTVDFDVYVNYGNYLTNEDGSTHNSSATGIPNASRTADLLYSYDASGLFGSISNNDVCSLHMEYSAGGAFGSHGILMQYTRV